MGHRSSEHAALIVQRDLVHAEQLLHADDVIPSAHSENLRRILRLSSRPSKKALGSVLLLLLMHVVVPSAQALGILVFEKE